MLRSTGPRACSQSQSGAPRGVKRRQRSAEATIDRGGAAPGFALAPRWGLSPPGRDGGRAWLGDAFGSSAGAAGDGVAGEALGSGDEGRSCGDATALVVSRHGLRNPTGR